MAVLLLFTSCQSINVAGFDSYSFEKTTYLKNKTLKLIEKSNESFTKNSQEIDILFLELETQYDYEKLKPNNQFTIAIWERLTNKETSFLRNYFILWEKKEKLSSEFMNQAIKQTNEAFEKIIALETKKNL